MKRGVRSLVVVAVVWGAQVDAAAEPVSGEACRALKEDGARLACFDRLFSVPEAATAPRVSDPPSAPPSIPREAPPVFAEERAQSQQASKGAEALPATTPAPVAAEPPALTVTRLRQTPRGRWIISLDNGSEWLQLDDRPLPVALGRAVALREGLLGGQFMRPEDGAGRSIKVERLR